MDKTTNKTKVAATGNSKATGLGCVGKRARKSGWTHLAASSSSASGRFLNREMISSSTSVPASVTCCS